MPAAQVDGPTLETAISGLTIASRQVSFISARTGL
jgi:hypothetical protein